MILHHTLDCHQNQGRWGSRSLSLETATSSLPLSQRLASLSLLEPFFHETDTAEPEPEHYSHNGTTERTQSCVLPALPHGSLRVSL